METDDVHADDNESNGQAAIGTFTVEARVEGIGEDYAEALAVRLAAMGLTVWIYGSDEGGVMMDANERAERALDRVPLRPTEREALLPFVRMAIKEAGREAVREFARRVEARAEANAAKTGVLDVYAAMKAELARLDIIPEQGSD